MRAPREGVPPAVWRIGGEVGFLVAVAVALGVAKLSWWAILVAMAGAFAIVCLIEWLAAREQQSFVQPKATAPAHPVVEAQRAADTDEHDSLGWTAFEEAQEPSDAMTIIGAPSREEEPIAEPVPEPEPEPAPEEPDLPPAAEAEEVSDSSRGWWRRRQNGKEAADGQELQRHVRVLPAAEELTRPDPWEEGFDGSEALGKSDEPALVEDEESRRFRRR
jgi:cytoskeletal protein RodZ